MMTLVLILVAHWIADLPCQSDWMRAEKWHNWRALTAHGLVYGSAMFVMLVLAPVVYALAKPDHYALATLLWVLVPSVAVYVAANTVLHVTQDAITSRLTHALWEAKRYRQFFNVICADQILHAATLIAIAQAWP